MAAFESVRASGRHQKRAGSASTGSGTEPTAFDGLLLEGGVATFLGQADEGRGEAIPEGMDGKGKSFMNQDPDHDGEDRGKPHGRASDLVRPPDQFRPDGRHEQQDQNHEATSVWLS